MSEDDDSDTEMYSYASSKTIYKRSRSRPSSVAPTETEYRTHKVYVSTDGDDQTSAYLPVARWAVDYNNKNYVRSLCNKNVGHHRKLQGRPQKYKIQYDNNYFTRSKVNEPKGLHRKIPEIKRKYVPDDDELADATGWEFDWGPEIDQVEQDVLFIPEGRITRRGCYRWYGVKRNDSDYDLKLDEDERENLLTEELEEELKYGQEFLQSDIPFMEEQKNRRYSRGGYRYYDTMRNVNDFKPDEAAEVSRDPEWRRKHHCNGFRYLDLEFCDCDSDVSSAHHHVHAKKGKPFRRTILNKVYTLKKEDSSKDLKRRATRLSLIPGEGRETVYEGVPDRTRYETPKSPSVRSVYKKKTEKFKTISEGDEYEEYEKVDTEQSYTELRPLHEERRHRKNEVRHGRRLPDEDLVRDKKGGRRFEEYTYRVKQEDKDRPKGRYARRGSVEDVRENYETWKENTLYKDEDDKKSKEKRKEKIYKGIGVERKRNEGKHYDREEVLLQRPVSNLRDRLHGDQIRKQKQFRVKDKPRGRDYGSTRLQHLTNRGKVIRDVNTFEDELTPDKEQFKKMPPRVEERVRNIQDRMERTDRKHKGRRDKEAFHHSDSDDNIDKEQTLKKMPPHVEEQIRNIRERMERADRKHTEKRDIGAFHHSSSDESIDLMKHKGHPKDRGELLNSEYEKYVTKNGSEIWVKKNEKYAELHHKSHR